MDFLFSLPKAVLDLAVGLLKIKKDDRTRQRLADLLKSVAECVSAIGDAIDAGEHPSQRCAELEVYIAKLHTFVEGETDKATAEKLTLWLTHVEAAPGLAKIDVARVIEDDTRPRW